MRKSIETVDDFSNWHNIEETPELHKYILFCDKEGINFYNGVILKENGYMFIDSDTAFWNEVVKSQGIQYWIYMSEIQVRRTK